jgi:hypothetical protein
MNLELHPSHYIFKQLKVCSDIQLQFSIYSHTPQTIFDQRTTFDLPITDIGDGWLESVLSSLSDGEELAFHSCIKESGKSYHLPMIDLDCSVEHLEAAKKILSRVLPRNISSSLVFYNSGRSLHAYSLMRLKPTKEWHDFMGRLLLANLPSHSPVVDSRWIGHRLIGGFSSLRWSSNSDAYLKIPERV